MRHTGIVIGVLISLLAYAAWLRWGVPQSWLLLVAVLLAPLFISWLLLLPLRRARQSEKQGDYEAALLAYKQQLAIVKHFPWLDGMYRLLTHDPRPGSLCELLLLHIAELHLTLREPESAVNALWRCLGSNSQNNDALELLDHIRTTATDHRIIGW